jgi:hypothetical protein
VDGPAPVPKGRRGGAAVGKLDTPAGESVSAEFRRIESLLKPDFQRRHFVTGEKSAPLPFGSPQCLEKFADLLGSKAALPLSDELPKDQRQPSNPLVRQQQQVKELERHVQSLVRWSDQVRNAYFLNTTTLMRTLAPRGQRFRMYRVKEQSPEVFAAEAAKFRKHLLEEVLGRVDDSPLQANPRSRRV